MLLRAEKGQRRPADRQRRRERPPRGPQKEPPPRTPRPWPCGLQSCETNFCCSGVAACGTSLRPPQAPDTPHVGSVAWGVRAGTAGRPSGNLGNCLQVESVNRKEFVPGDTTGLEGPPERAGDAAAGPVSLPNRAPSKSRSAWKVNANFCKRPCSGPAGAPGVASTPEPAGADPVRSHRYGERITFHLHQEGGLEAVYIRRRWIIVFIYSSAQRSSNSPALRHT